VPARSYRSRRARRSPRSRPCRPDSAPVTRFVRPANSWWRPTKVRAVAGSWPWHLPFGRVPRRRWPGGSSPGSAVRMRWYSSRRSALGSTPQLRRQRPCRRSWNTARASALAAGSVTTPSSAAHASDSRSGCSPNEPGQIDNGVGVLADGQRYGRPEFAGDDIAFVQARRAFGVDQRAAEPAERLTSPTTRSADVNRSAAFAHSLCRR